MIRIRGGGFRKGYDAGLPEIRIPRNVLTGGSHPDAPGYRRRAR
jgi:hypothetical protein